MKMVCGIKQLTFLIAPLKVLRLQKIWRLVLLQYCLVFFHLHAAQENMFRLRRAYNPVQLNESVTQLISELRIITKPKPTTLFPKDLDVTNNILVGLLDLLMEESLPGIHLVRFVEVLMCCHAVMMVHSIQGLIDVLDNLLHENNTEGWRLLSEVSARFRRKEFKLLFLTVLIVMCISSQPSKLIILDK